MNDDASAGTVIVVADDAMQAARVEAGLHALEKVWAGDPNLVALEAELTALESRLAAAGESG